MGILHDALASLRATADKAIEFADPDKAIAAAEDKFKSAVAEAYSAIEARVEALEKGAGITATTAASETSDALADVKSLLHSLIERLEGVESHPALSVPATPPAPPPPASTPAPTPQASSPAAPAAAPAANAAPTGEEIAAAALAAAANGQASA